MKGIIRTYLPEMRYGFIKGDDGKDYFFHESECRDRSQAAQLCKQAFVDFDKLLPNRPSRIPTYATPDEFVTSRSNDARGWEIIERGNWIVHGTSRNSPDSARQEAVANATRVRLSLWDEFSVFRRRAEREQLWIRAR